jgi:hypothetical protein
MDRLDTASRSGRLVIDIVRSNTAIRDASILYFLDITTNAIIKNGSR